jgi:hypothetical protein
VAFVRARSRCTNIVVVCYCGAVAPALHSRRKDKGKEYHAPQRGFTIECGANGALDWPTGGVVLDTATRVVRRGLTPSPDLVSALFPGVCRGVPAPSARTRK